MKGACAAGLAAALAAACGSSLRTAETGPRPLSQNPVPVSEPSPVHKVESVPKDPGGDCVWLDGRWEWVDRAWEWTAGSWVNPPRGCHFAPPETTWATQGPSGELFYFPGRWYPDAADGPACAAATPCGNAVATSPSRNTETTP